MFLYKAKHMRVFLAVVYGISFLVNIYVMETQRREFIQGSVLEDYKIDFFNEEEKADVRERHEKVNETGNLKTSILIEMVRETFYMIFFYSILFLNIVPSLWRFTTKMFLRMETTNEEPGPKQENSQACEEESPLENLSFRRIFTCSIVFLFLLNLPRVVISLCMLLFDFVLCGFFSGTALWNSIIQNALSVLEYTSSIISLYFCRKKTLVVQFLVLSLLLCVEDYVMLYIGVSYNYIFQEKSPLQENSLKQKIKKLCEKVGFSVENVFLISLDVPNFSFGGIFGRNMIFLWEKMEKYFSENEILSILAHELGHWNYMHVYMFFLPKLVLGVVFASFLLLQAKKKVFSKMFGIKNMPMFVEFCLGLVLYRRATDIILENLSKIFSCLAEFQADSFGARNTSPADFVSAFTRLSFLSPRSCFYNRAYVFLRETHPIMADRIRRVLGK
ncbi:MAG: CAAX prenyl protease 1-like protein [Amphiamblys sp. WSBS2006]|nr:MAG: CAAX prenyl protease 1-like protein [Amphiamblys sp. WSBS2006]